MTPSQVLGPARAAAGVVAWAVVTALWAVVGSTLLGHTLHPTHAALQAVFPELGLAASVLLLIAVGTRRPVLALVCGAMVVAVLMPAVAPALDKRDGKLNQRAMLSVYVGNLRYDNETPDDKVDQALTSGADVLVVLELTPDFVRRFEAAGAGERYPHQLLDPAPHPHGEGIYSRLPFSRGATVAVGPMDSLFIHVEVGDRTVEIVSVHTHAPVNRPGMHRWREELQALEHLVAEFDRPTLLAGDFNADRWHPPFRRVLDGPVVDAHGHVGKGLSSSWPSAGRLGRLGPRTRLDHAVVHDLAVLDVVDLPGAGSDHTAFVVALGVG